MRTGTPAAPITETPDVRRTIRGAVVWPPRLVVVLLVVSFAAGLEVPEAVQYLPFAASLVLLGLPHGALDPLVPTRLSGRRAALPTVLAVVLLYLVLSGLYLALWFAAPGVSFALFITLTIFHWGAGDLHALLAFGPVELRALGRATRALVLLSRGAVPMLVPLLAFPGVYREVSADAAGLFGAGVGGLAFSPAFRFTAGAALLAVVVLSLLSGLRDLRKDRRLLLPYAGETVLLVLYFAVVPPVLAVGLYFCLWHSLHHIARLVLLDRSGASALGAGATRFVREALPLTALALALLAGLYFTVPGGADGAGALLALYLVLVSVLTLPHAVVVSYMDLRQGLWCSVMARDLP